MDAQNRFSGSQTWIFRDLANSKSLLLEEEKNWAIPKVAGLAAKASSKPGARIAQDPPPRPACAQPARPQTRQILLRGRAKANTAASPTIKPKADKQRIRLM